MGDRGVLAGCRPGAILVDMSTSEPSLAVAIADAAAARGVQSVDAPVSGGDVGAREARLSIMAGGDAAVIEALRPAGRRWARRSSARAGPARANTPRWSTKSSSPPT